MPRTPGVYDSFLRPILLDFGTLSLQSTASPGHGDEFYRLLPQLHRFDKTKAEPITGDELRAIVPSVGSRGEELAAALNKAMEIAGITTRIGQAMFIAQMAHESDRFRGKVIVEGDVDRPYVFNSQKPDVIERQYGRAFLTDLMQVKGLKLKRQNKEGSVADWQRCLANPSEISLWEQSAQKYVRAKAAYEAAHPKQPFETCTGPEKWKPSQRTEFLPGDVKVPRWQLLYDCTSPWGRRAVFAKSSLGNHTAGDGQRYIGRGYVQLTGRSNYQSATKYLQEHYDKSLNLVTDYKRAADPELAPIIAGWFWRFVARNNRFIQSDSKENFTSVTVGINGGTVGLPDRLALFKAAKKVLIPERPLPPFWELPRPFQPC